MARHPEQGLRMMSGLGFALLVPLLLVAVVHAVNAAPVAAAPHASSQNGKANWNKRDFNGLWVPVGGGLDDPDGDSAPDTAEPEPPTDDAGNVNESGFDTLPELKGVYLQEYQQRKKSGVDFGVACKPGGMPTLMAGPYANEILQNSKQINWYQEFPGETWRIYLDGRPHPDPEEYPATLTGHSTGKWKGNTLVVETVNVRTDTLLYDEGRSEHGLGHSSKMRIVQRIHLLDPDSLQIDGTVEDPEALVKPWHYTLNYHRRSGEIVEYLCDDNNHESIDPETGRDVTHIPARRNP